MESKLVLHTKTRHINVYAHPENVTHLTKDKMGTLNLQGGMVAYVKQFVDEHNQDESAHPYIQENLEAHISDINNPHAVTKEQVGLGNVDNTSDADKPVSMATQAALDGKQATISDLETIRSGAALGATSVQPDDLATVATTGDYDDLTNKPTIPSQASDVHALPDTTKYGASLDLDINSSTYVVTAQLKDQDGNTLGTSQTIDLPLESVVVSGSYDSANKKVVLTLQNGSTIEFSVADLVAGLQNEITSTNKLSADLVDDTSTTHKFVTTSEKSTWNGKQDTISDLTAIRSNASAGANAATTIAGYGDIVSHDASEFAIDSNAVHKTGDETIAGTKTFTGKVVSPIVETGSAASNYFQCQKFRGQGNADTYYHAIDFGYQNHDQVDFYEYGGKWVFHKHTGSAQSSGDTIVGQILSTGWNGPVVGNVTGDLAGTASRATADADGNTISSTYLPLAGGTMTGNISWVGADNKTFAIQLNNNNANIDGGWSYSSGQGAGFALRSTSYGTAAERGAFAIFARNGTSSANTKQLKGYPNGSLKWDGKEVLTTARVDGTTIKANSSDVISVDTAELSTMTGATSSAAGAKGLVPAPAAGDEAKFLRGDGTWVGSTSAVAWGSLTGTLSDQTDLQTALNAKANDSDVVHKTGDEAIAGQKRFTDNVLIFKRSPFLFNVSSTLTRGTYVDDAGEIKQIAWDKNSNLLSELRTYVESNGNTSFCIGVCSQDENDTQIYKTVFRGTTRKDGQSEISMAQNAVVYAPTPATSDNSTKIATTAFVKSQTHLIETYVNGTSWYNVWEIHNPSTGALIGKWCEQGGRFAGPVNNSSSFTVSFLKNMANTSYAVSFCGTTTSTVLTATARYKNSLQFFYSNNLNNVSGSDFSWQIRGYME